jgi:hypothetical protein
MKPMPAKPRIIIAAAASMGYARGKLIEAKTLPFDRKDWCD